MIGAVRSETAARSWHFPGGKGRNGVYQRLINQMPPHRVYIETHLGGGAVMRHKRPAEINFGVDLDPKVLARWRGVPKVQLVQADAATFLRSLRLRGEELVYADPPYLGAARRSPRSPYRFGYTEEDHVELLEALKALPCMVMISGYWSPLYARMLAGWRTMRFPARLRSGEMAEEWVWMNYPEPAALHDYRYLGETFRERERIQRRIRRWRKRLASLPALERKAIIASLADAERS